jgi:hypothetical protein
LAGKISKWTGKETRPYKKTGKFKKQPATSKVKAPEAPKAAKPLPPPVPVEPAESNAPILGPGAESSAPYGNFSAPPLVEPGIDEPLSAEAEKILAGIPAIAPEGEAADDPGAPPSDPMLLSLAGMVAFEEQDVQDTLQEFFSYLAGKFESDHWELTERQARMLGKPSTLLLNSLWTKLQTLLPNIIARWCESTPGAMAFITACGLVLVPKVVTQMKISRERRKAKSPVIEPPRPPQQPEPPKPQPIRAGVLYTDGRAG